MMVSNDSRPPLQAQLPTAVLHFHITLSDTPIRGARSPLTEQTTADESKPRKKHNRSSRTPRTSGDLPNAGDSLPTPSSQKSPAKVQTPQLKPQSLPQTTPTQGSPTGKATPKSTLKALPSVRDHTSSELGPEGDEYIPREFDEEGDKKVDALGYPQDGRQYKMKTFTLPGRGDKLFMLATECARVLAYRDSYLLFNKNRSLHKIIASQEEKDNLIQQDHLPYAYRSRQIAIVTARSMFRQFGSRVIRDGRRVRDDYWEAKARKQGFTEEDAAGEKRPGATKAKEAAAAEQLGARQTMFQPSDIVYSTGPGFGMMQPPPMHSGIASTMAPLPVIDPVHNRYGEIQRPRQDITGPPYIDTTRTSNETELMSQATHAAEFSKQLNMGRDFRKNMLEDYWQRPHDPPVSTPQSQPSEPVPAPASQPFNSPRYSTTDFTSSNQPSMLHQQQSSQQSMNPPPPNFSHASTMQQSPLARPPSIPLQPNPLQQSYGQPQLHRNPSMSSQSPSQFQGYPPQMPQQWGAPPPQPRPYPSQMSPSPHMGHQGVPHSPSPHPQQQPNQQQLFAMQQQHLLQQQQRAYPGQQGQGGYPGQQYMGGQGGQQFQ
jgi:hypothetical protein